MSLGAKNRYFKIEKRKSRMKGVVRLRRLNQRPSSQNHVAQTRLSQTKCATNDNNSRPVVTTVVTRMVTTVYLLKNLKKGLFSVKNEGISESKTSKSLILKTLKRSLEWGHFNWGHSRVNERILINIETSRNPKFMDGLI